MASGIEQGVNVQQASAGLSMDERFSEYLPTLMNVNMFGQEGIGGMVFPKALDGGVRRFRQRIIVSEQSRGGHSFAEMTAQWEAARRAGRGQSINVTVDSWRDKAGTLWAPNAVASIAMPALKLTTRANDWVIGSVSFVRDAERGTVADLVMMPKQAFQPQPLILIPSIFDPTASPSPAPQTGPGGLLGHV